MPNQVPFTDNEELIIAKAWLEQKNNKQIARELNKSEAYVSQVVKNIKEKIERLENSIELLEKLRIIEPVAPLRFRLQRPNPHFSRPTELQQPEIQPPRSTPRRSILFPSSDAAPEEFWASSSYEDPKRPTDFLSPYQ